MNRVSCGRGENRVRCGRGVNRVRCGRGVNRVRWDRGVTMVGGVGVGSGEMGQGVTCPVPQGYHQLHIRTEAKASKSVSLSHMTKWEILRPVGNL